MRNPLRRFAVPLAAITTLSAFLVVIGAPALPAGASPSQAGGDDTAAYQPGWTWTYAQVFTLNDPGTGFFQIDETVTYTVAGIVSHTNYTCPASYQGGVCTSSTPGATAVGTYNTYQVNFHGAVTGGTGNASGQTLSITNGSSSASGTEWLETSNLASVELDQNQHIVGTAASGLENVTIDFTNDDVYTPAQVNQDFRLHSTDQWLENTVVYDNGVVNFVATGVSPQSGTSPIDTYGPINATATDTAGSATETVNGTTAAYPGDSINYNDAADNTSDTRVWSNTFHNLLSDHFLSGIPQGQTCNSAQTASCEDTTMALTAASTPAPSVSVSEAISGPTNGLACGGQSVNVSGTLSTGATGAPVAIGVDQSTIVPGQVVTTNTTTTSGGAYSANVTAPNMADGLVKPGVNGTFGVEVGAGGATNVVTLEVSPQDCTSTTYNGATSGAVGSSAPVSATVTDIATHAPVAGATVTFSLAGQAGTASGVTNGSGLATANLTITDAPSATPYTLTASYAGGPADTASSATANFTVGLDPTSTSITPSEPTATVGDLVTFTAHVAPTGPSFGALSGTVTFSIDGNQIGSPVTLVSGSATSASVDTSTVGIGTHNVTAVYSGNADYAASTGNLSYVVHKPLTPTTTSLVVSPSGSSLFGEPVSLTATVSPTVDNTNAAVTFFDGSTTLGTANLNGSTPDTASLSVSSLTVGSHSLTAQYTGDGNVTFGPSTSNPVALTVNQAPTTTTVTLVTPSSTPFAFEPVTFGIAVAPPAGDVATPSGTVQVAVNGVNLGGPLTLSGGQVTVNDPGLTAGSNTVTATYSGDPGFAGSNGSLAQTVNRASTATSLVSSTGSSGSVQNQVVTFTANVAPQAAGNPSGLVTFFDCPTSAPCSTQIGQSTLSPTGSAGSQATLQLSNLPVGDNFITVSYAGDANFTGSSSSPPFDQVVSPPPPIAATSTSVSGATSPPGAPNTSVYGQAVTFTATISVSGSQGAATAPGGTVQFSIDGTNFGGPVTVTPGSGSPGTGWTSTATSPPISSLLAGGHSVIATYSGLTGSGIPQAFQGSGAIVTQEVHQAATTVSGVPSANPAAYGQAVTFTATLHAVAPGAGVPGGTVQFSLDGSAFGNPVPVSGGQATSSAATGLLPGTHSVSFVTSGDPNFLGSSGSFSFVVSLIPTQTGLTVAPNPSIFGHAVTLTATVTHGTGPGTPTGTVTFRDGSTVVATQAVAPTIAGQAQALYTTTTFAVGAHSLTATYSGDGSFSGSASAPVVLNVGKQPTMVIAYSAILTENLSNLLAPTGVLSLQPISASLLTTTGLPIAGQTLVFTAEASPGGPVVCTAVTNAQGYAQCTPSLVGTLEVDVTGGFTATYAGNASYLGSGSSAGLITIIL